jgi:hypothetical protein
LTSIPFLQVDEVVVLLQTEIVSVLNTVLSRPCYQAFDHVLTVSLIHRLITPPPFLQVV